MLHVDEGTLHALVDNALDADERRDVEAHVASCGECARRFAEATAMARQVTTLLGALDDVGGAVRIVAPSGTAAVADRVMTVPRETNVTPIRRATFTLRRIAIAASVMLVAGVSYQVGQRGDGARERASLIVPVRAPAKSAPMVATPSVVDAPADSYVAAAPPAVRQRASAGPRNEAEVSTADRVADYASKKASTVSAPPSVAAATQLTARPMPVTASGMADSSVDVRRRDVAQESSSDAGARVQAQQQQQQQQRAQQPGTQQNAPSAEPAAPKRESPRRFGAVTASGASAAAPSQSVNAAGAAAKLSAPKPIALAGYTTMEEESVPSVTRRRYVSSSGLSVLLLIVQPLAEAKGQRAQDVSSEFMVSTANGHSTIRWHARGLDYELQAPLAPDSLMKLATQLK